MYPWPIGDFDNAMDVALDTAMNYLEHGNEGVDGASRLSHNSLTGPPKKEGERHSTGERDHTLMPVFGGDDPSAS